jgi:hypothetical protein
MLELIFSLFASFLTFFQILLVCPNRLDSIFVPLSSLTIKTDYMDTLKVINQNKYFKVIEVFGIRFINVKKAGVSININGELFYKLPSIVSQSNTLVLK